MVAPYLADYGWEAEVLAVQPAQLAVPMDPWLHAGFPKNVPIHACEVWSRRWSVVPGLGTLDFRALGPMRQHGNRLLHDRRFDLVYFSTTVFTLFSLGPVWKLRFGVPFAVDYQDPWFTDYYREHPSIRPPGGRMKYTIVDRIARYREPKVIRSVSGITAVSSAYIDQLKSRYPAAKSVPSLTLPFPGSARDWERVRSEAVSQQYFDAKDGLVHWVYVGVSGPAMSLALESLFLSLATVRQRSPSQVAKIRLHFIGTSYAPSGKGQPVVKPIADRFGVGDLVTEQTDRIPYSQALACLRDADALLALGTNDETYNASKLMPYLMAKKPMLAVFHQNSPAASMIEEQGGATLVTFHGQENATTIANRITLAWMSRPESCSIKPWFESNAQTLFDNGQAKVLCDFFDRLLT
jgi:glycosyltransferase involved in cell wall biosynthesis